MNALAVGDGQKVAFMESAVHAAIQDEIGKEVKKAVEKAKEELDRKIPEIVAGLAIRLSSGISMSHMRNELVIHIRMEGNGSPS